MKEVPLRNLVSHCVFRHQGVSVSLRLPILRIYVLVTLGISKWIPAFVGFGLCAFDIFDLVGGVNRFNFFYFRLATCDVVVNHVVSDEFGSRRRYIFK